MTVMKKKTKVENRNSSQLSSMKSELAQTPNGVPKLNIMTKKNSTIYAGDSRNDSSRLVKFDSPNKLRSELATASSRMNTGQNSLQGSPLRKGGMTLGGAQPRHEDSRDSLFDRPIREYNRSTQNHNQIKKYMMGSSNLNDNVLNLMIQNFDKKH